jgi:hypothetical protein
MQRQGELRRQRPGLLQDMEAKKVLAEAWLIVAGEHELERNQGGNERKVCQAATDRHHQAFPLASHQNSEKRGQGRERKRRFVAQCRRKHQQPGQNLSSRPSCARGSLDHVKRTNHEKGREQA